MPQAHSARPEPATYYEPRECNVQNPQTNWLNRPPSFITSGQAVEPPCQAKTWDEVLYINREHRVLICKLCRIAVVPGKGLESHLRHEHRIQGAVLREAVVHSSMSLSTRIKIRYRRTGRELYPSSQRITAIVVRSAGIVLEHGILSSVIGGSRNTR